RADRRRFLSVQLAPTFTGNPSPRPRSRRPGACNPGEICPPRLRGVPLATSRGDRRGRLGVGVLHPPARYSSAVLGPSLAHAPRGSGRVNLVVACAGRRSGDVRGRVRPVTRPVGYGTGPRRTRPEIGPALSSHNRASSHNARSTEGGAEPAGELVE